MSETPQIRNDASRLVDTGTANDSHARALMLTGSAIGIARLTVFLIALMAFSKLVIGFLINSVALLSEGIHTLLDLFAAIVSYYTVRVSTEPADPEHRYGHGKIENAAGIAQAAFIFFPTALIIWRAVRRLIIPGQGVVVDGLDLGSGVMFATMLINIFLALRLLKVAKDTKSEAIRAAAYHQLNDLWTSVGVLVALLLIWWKPEWEILDPLVALAVTMISIWMAWSLFRESLMHLLDTSAGLEVDNAVLSILDKYKPIVQNYHNLRTRRAGTVVFVDIRVELCSELSFREGHKITEQIENAITEAIPGADVIIHPDPCQKFCDECDYPKIVKIKINE